MTDEIREQRIRRGLDRLAGLVAQTDTDRTLRWLGDEMAEDAQISLRLPQALVDQAEALTSRLALDPSIAAAAVTVNRSVVIRVAIARGLDVLDQELPATSTKTKKRKR